ncbi:hypothetical protein [Gordonia soli]|nr:hypothetical protein [Gordonia soli]
MRAKDKYLERASTHPDRRPIRPEDVLADGVDKAQFGDVEVRKGSVAAFVANAKIFDRLPADDPDNETIRAQLLELLPAIRSAGVLDVFTPRSARLAALIDS